MTFAITVGPATDYLYGLAQQAVSGISVNGKLAVACDGPADELTFGMFVVGIDGPPPEESGQTSGAGLAITTMGVSNMLREDYVIPCYIDVRVSGDTQKTARDLAESIFNPFANALMADPSADALLHGGNASFSMLTSTPFSVGTAAEPGRRQLITFGIRCTGLIN